MANNCNQMSRFDKGLPVKLDANGNLDTTVLAKELTAALAYDVHYKQMDNMKKKAVKTSGTYDEFKAMVACSHLKTLTSKEVESLSSKKTGWQRDFRASNASEAHILAHEAKKMGIEQAKVVANTARTTVDTFQVPRNLVVLEGDLCRTLQTNDARMQYLLALGLKRLKILLKGDKECTPDLLECLLDTVVHAVASQRSTELLVDEDEESNESFAGAGFVSVHGIEGTCDAVTGAEKSSASAELQEQQQESREVEPEQGAGKEKKKIMNPYKWFKAVSSFSRFHVTLLFIPKPLVAAAMEFLEAYQPADDSKMEDVLQVRARFQID